MSARAAETALTTRALELLARGPAGSVPLIEYVCQMPGAPQLVAEQMALALFAEHPAIARDAEGRWTLARAPRAESEKAKRLADLTYAVIDVETTGMHPGAGDRVTEVAVVIVRGGTLAERFESLVNPQRPIPPFITSLTHISWEMVKDAPTFADLAPDLVRFLDGHVFVAHNADFDWRFVRAEVQRATGKRLSGPKLCTVRLARRVLPHLPSRRLDALMFHFGIDNDARHRAMGDANATARILLRLLEEDAARACGSWEELQGLIGTSARGYRARPWER